MNKICNKCTEVKDLKEFKIYNHNTQEYDNKYLCDKCMNKICENWLDPIKIGGFN